VSKEMSHSTTMRAADGVEKNSLHLRASRARALVSGFAEAQTRGVLSEGDAVPCACAKRWGLGRRLARRREHRFQRQSPRHRRGSKKRGKNEAVMAKRGSRSKRRSSLFPSLFPFFAARSSFPWAAPDPPSRSLTCPPSPSFPWPRSSPQPPPSLTPRGSSPARRARRRGSRRRRSWCSSCRSSSRWTGSSSWQSSKHSSWAH